MYTYGKQRKDWNESLCNPFNRDNRKGCKDGNVLPNPSLVPPEQPYIRGISHPRESPFVNVEKLRTPIDNLFFEVYVYVNKPDDDLEGTPILEVLVYKYQAYLPKDIFLFDGYYVVRCYAINDAGNSIWSNNYILDYSITDPCVASIGGLDGTNFYMKGTWKKNCIMFAKK